VTLLASKKFYLAAIPFRLQIITTGDSSSRHNVYDLENFEQLGNITRSLQTSILGILEGRLVCCAGRLQEAQLSCFQKLINSFSYRRLYLVGLCGFVVDFVLSNLRFEKSWAENCHIPNRGII